MCSMTLFAMPDDADLGYSPLGTLRPIEDEPAIAVNLAKRIKVRNIGNYTKHLITPMYRKQAMRNYCSTTNSLSFEPSSCIGVLCSSLNCRPDGYVTRKSGLHRFCLPVYQPVRLSGAFYRVSGYMLTETGYLAVAKRRWGLWLTLSLLCGTLFVLGYLTYAHGVEGVFDELARFWQQYF